MKMKRSACGGVKATALVKINLERHGVAHVAVIS